MMRARLCLLLPISLCACERGNRPTTTSPTDEPQPVVAVDGKALPSGEGVPIVAIPQRPISSDPSAWCFDPSGRLIAESFTDDDSGAMGCGIWDIESGSFVRAQVYTGEEDEETPDPCYDWLQDSSAPSDVSADGKLRASVDGGLEIEVIGGATRSLRGCASCDGAMVWAPSGHQLATCNGTMLEIWDADTGKRVRSETIGLGDVGETRMGWTEAGLGVLVLHEVTGTCEELEPEGSYCNWAEVEDEESGELNGYALSSYWWPADGGPPVAKPEQYKSAEVPDFFTDAGMRWFAFSKDVDYDRDGSATTVSVFGIGNRTSALGWTESDADDEWSEPEGGHWRVDAATQWIEGLRIDSGSTDYYGHLELAWNAIVAEPNPAFFHGQLVEVEGDGATGEVQVFGAASGTVAAQWNTCFHYDGEDECKSGGPPTRDCELLDVSPSLSLSLLHCDAGLLLAEASGRGATVLALTHDPDSHWRWGRGNYLALHQPHGAFEVIDLASGKSLYKRQDVDLLLEVPLAPEQDRLALLYADHLEIVAGATGQGVIDLPGEWTAAALSPDGKQLAVLGGQEVRVIEIASKATISSAAIEDQWGVAWRQDGAALFYGYDWPTHAIDPKTGKLLHELSHPIIDMIQPDELDPSWRWIHRPDGSITRTLDFQRIEFGPTWARVDSGLFEGELRDLPDNLRFRVGDDGEAPAIHTVEELEPWLRTQGLVAAFFAGAPLPSPSLGEKR